MSAAGIPYLTAADIHASTTPAMAVTAIEDALRSGLDPKDDLVRTATGLRNGQFLLMPSEAGASAGVKIASVAPGNPRRGLPRIQALYVLFDAATLTPRALLDGTALTTLRTPAVSFAAVRSAVSRLGHAPRILLFGAGPQGRAHVDTLRSLHGPEAVAHVTYVVRNPDRVDRSTVGAAPVIRAGAHHGAVAEADLIVCATSASTPCFDSNQAKDDCVVVAVGSHRPDAREIDSAFVGRAQVVVEDVETACRESGDIVMAIADGVITADRLVAMRDVVDGSRRLEAGRPVLFKSSGMSWEDLIVANTVLEASTRRRQDR